MLEAVGRRILLAVGYRSRHVETSAGRVHVWSTAGTGPLPPLVLFHGFGSSAMHWMPLLQQLRPLTRGIVALDLPGHGLSDRPPQLTDAMLRAGVSEAMDAVDHEPAVVIGNSLGGAVGLRYLNAHPERVLGAVLFSPAGAPMTAEDLVALRAVFRMDQHADAVRFVRRLHGRPVGVRAHLLAPILRRTLADPVLKAWLDGVSEGDFLGPDELRAVSRPLRVIWGRQERILPPDALAYWRAHLPPSCEVLEPEGFGHSPFLDDRHWTARQVASFAEAVAAR